MSKAIAKTVRYSLILVGLLVIALLVAPFFIDVNVYKDKIEQTVENATGRHLSVGQIHASLFPWVGVELSDVHFANRPGFSKRDFISVKRLHIKLALLPLLSKSIEIQHFEVVDPVIYLERHSNGETNWADLTHASSKANAHGATASQASTPAQSAPAAPMLAALQAQSLSLVGGDITWADANATPVVLSHLDIALNDVQLKRPVSIHMSGALSGNAFELDANIGPVGDLAKLNPLTLPVQGHLTVNDMSLKPFKQMIKGWPAQLGDVGNASVNIIAQIEQRPDGIRLGEGKLQLSAAHKLGLDWKIEMPKTDQLMINRTSIIVDDKNVLKVKGKLNQLTSNPTYQLRIESQPMTRTWLSTFVPDLKAMYDAHPAPWKQIKLNASLAGDAKQLKIKALQVALDGDLLRATGAVVFARPDIRLRMSAKELHLDPWLPQGKQEPEAAMRNKPVSIIGSAVAAEAATAEPDLRFLRPWVVTSRLQVGTLFMRGLEMEHFSATINGANGHFDLSPLSFKLAGGKVTEKASLNVASYPAKWTESVHITDVQAGPLLQALAKMDMLTGNMAMDTNFRATGLTPAAVNSLNGRGNVLFKDGTLKGFDIAGAIRKFTNPAAYQDGPKETDFAQLSGSFNVRNGVADNQDLFMTSPLLRVTGKGIVNLVSKTMDYHVKPRIVGSLKGQGGSMLRKGLTVPLHISGAFSAPKVRPEINARTLIDNAPALLHKGKIGGALGHMLGGKQSGAQGKPAASPQKDILKGLGGLIPGF